MLVVGIIGSLLLALCAVPQAWACHKQGHAYGVDYWFLGMWTSGELLALLYTVSLNEVPWPLVANYVLNLTCLAVIIRYKAWPRRGC